MMSSFGSEVRLYVKFYVAFIQRNTILRSCGNITTNGPYTACGPQGTCDFGDFSCDLRNFIYQTVSLKVPPLPRFWPKSKGGGVTLKGGTFSETV